MALIVLENNHVVIQVHIIQYVCKHEFFSFPNEINFYFVHCLWLIL